MVFSKLKVGDKVALYAHTGGVYLSVIEKVSSTHITVRGHKYQIHTGKPVMDFVTDYLEVLTPKVAKDINASRAEREAAKLVQEIKDFDYTGVSLATLKAVLVMLEEGGAE